jgi:hypothetical protein
MNITSYQKNNDATAPMATEIDLNVSTMEEKDTDAVSWSRSPRSKLALAVLGALALASFAFVSTKSDVQQETAMLSTSNVGLLGSVKSTHSISPCTFKECSESRCNANVAPYTCLFHNGGPHGGCSAVEWTKDTCTKQCDLTNCDSLEIPKDVPDCGVPCGDEWCASFPDRLCGAKVPYQCLAGASTFGCSADKYTWTYKTPATACSMCCDTRMC